MTCSGSLKTSDLELILVYLINSRGLLFDNLFTVEL